MSSDAVPPTADGYPPEKHILRDLRISSLWDTEHTHRCEAPTAPELCDSAGRVHLGVLATMVDIGGAAVGLPAVAPDWIATSDLSIHRGAADLTAADERIVVTTSLVRAGATSAVVECDVRGSGADKAAAAALLTFSRIPASTTAVVVEDRGFEVGERRELGLPDSGFTSVIRDALGIVEHDGSLVLPKSDYVHNSFGTINGGVTALFIEAAAEHAVHALPEPPPAPVVVGLSVHYVGRVKAGPAVARVTIVRADARGATIRVDVIDESNERLIAVGLVTAAATR